MPINKSNSSSASVVFEKDVYEQLKEVSRRNKRSISKQVAYWVEEMLKQEANKDK